jgi:hypothetical protein
MHLTHWQAMVLFALVVSVAFAFLSRETLRDRIRYAALSFLMFLAVGIGLGWVMYWVQR